MTWPEVFAISVSGLSTHSAATLWTLLPSTRINVAEYGAKTCVLLHTSAPEATIVVGLACESVKDFIFVGEKLFRLKVTCAWLEGSLLTTMSVMLWPAGPSEAYTLKRPGSALWTAETEIGRKPRKLPSALR